MNPPDPLRPYTAPLHDHSSAAARGDCEASSVDDSTACPPGAPAAPPPCDDDQHRPPHPPDAPRSHENAAEDTNVDPASPACDSDTPANSHSTSPPQHPAGQYPALESHTRVYNSWSKDESTKLIDLVQQYGTNRKWSLIAKHLPGRTGKQCRDRWNNHLRPGLKQGSWTPEEDYVVAYWHSCRGGSWAAIAFWLPGRTAVAIKNHWNAVSKLPDQGNKGTVLVTYTALLRSGLSREDAFDQAVAKVGMPRVRTAVLEQTLAAARVPPNTVVHPPRWDDILTPHHAAAGGPRAALPSPHRLHLQDPELANSLARLRGHHSHPHAAAAHPLHDLSRAASGGYHRAALPTAALGGHPTLSRAPHFAAYQPLYPSQPPTAAPQDSLTSAHPSGAHSLSTASFLDPSDLAPSADPTTGRALAHLPPPRQSNPSIGSPDSICSVPSITEPHLAPLNPPAGGPPSPPPAALRSLPHDPSALAHPPRHPTAPPDPRSPFRRSKPLSPFQLPTQTLPTEMPPSLLDPLAPPSLQPSTQPRDTFQLARQQAAYRVLLSRHADRLERQASAPTNLGPSPAAPDHQAPAPIRIPPMRATSLSAFPSPHQPSPSSHPHPHPHPHHQSPAPPSTDSHLPSTTSSHHPPTSDPSQPTPSWQQPSSNPAPTRRPLPDTDHPSSLLSSAAPASAPAFFTHLPPPPAPHPPPPSHTLAALEAEANFLEWAMSARSYSSDTSAARSAAAAAAAAADLEAAATWASTSAGSQWRQHPGAASEAALQAAGLGGLMEVDPRLEALLQREELLQEYVTGGLPVRDYAPGASLQDHLAPSGYPSGGAAAVGYSGAACYASGGLPAVTGGATSSWATLGLKREAPDDPSGLYGAESESQASGGWRARAGGPDLLQNKYLRLGYPPEQGGGDGGGAPGPAQ